MSAGERKRLKMNQRSSSGNQPAIISHSNIDGSARLLQLQARYVVEECYVYWYKDSQQLWYRRSASYMKDRIVKPVNA